MFFKGKALKSTLKEMAFSEQDSALFPSTQCWPYAAGSVVLGGEKSGHTEGTVVNTVIFAVCIKRSGNRRKTLLRLFASARLRPAHRGACA